MSNIFNKLLFVIILIIIAFLAYPVFLDANLLSISMDNRPKILIDPGHGGVDPGAVYGDFYEKDTTLEVSKKLKKYLTRHGFNVVMTRYKDQTLSQKQRVEIINKENPLLFISIHVNSFRDPYVKGMEIHWYNNQSKDLAQIIANSLQKRQSLTNIRGALRSRYYVIKNTNVPGILLEIGYITNPSDKYCITVDYGQKLIAEAIGGSITTFIKHQELKESAQNKTESKPFQFNDILDSIKSFYDGIMKNLKAYIPG